MNQTYIDDALWDRDERFTIWGQNVKGQGHGGIKCWKQHFLGFLTRLEKHLSEFHQTYTDDVLWDRDECVKFCGQKVRV